MKPEEKQKMQDEIDELKKKVEDLYSPTSFPVSIMENLTKNGFVKITQTLPTSYTTNTGFKAVYYYMFSDIDGKKVVFSNISYKDFTKIQSINTSTDTFTASNHGLGDGDILTFWSTTTPPGPITMGQTVYVVSSATDTFKLSATLGGAAIDLTDIGTGLHFLQRINILT